MIEVYLTNLAREKSGLISTDKEIKITVLGHAGYSDKNGDVVCAGVSAIIQTAIIAINKVAKIKQKIKQKKGYLESTISVNKLEKNVLNNLLIIISTMLVGLEEIIKINPDALKIYIEKE